MSIEKVCLKYMKSMVIVYIAILLMMGDNGVPITHKIRDPKVFSS